MQTVETEKEGDGERRTPEPDPISQKSPSQLENAYRRTPIVQVDKISFKEHYSDGR